jgi:ribonuclease HII
MPDFSIESGLIASGHRLVCGVDEAGRGCLAGAVTAACVILNPEDLPEGVDDSKKLSAARRSELYDLIMEKAIAIGVACVEASEIDSTNILIATMKAMRLAIHELPMRPGYACIDGNIIPQDLPCLAAAYVGGDARSLSIAAKESRSRLMQRLDVALPGYGFASHDGYGTAAHLEALARLGPSPQHRMTFAPLKPWWTEPEIIKPRKRKSPPAAQLSFFDSMAT